MDIQDRLQAHMRSELANTPVSDLGGVMERGDTIRRRRRAVMAAAPVVVVVLGVVAVMASSGLWSDASEADIETLAAADAHLSLDLGDLDWEIQPATLGWAIETVADEGTLYVLSTAPGARWEDFPNGNVPHALYTSSDGREWAPTLLGDWRASGVAASDGLLYLVGTAPGAEVGSVTVQVRVSSDGGTTFDIRDLPVNAPAGAQVSADLIAADGGVLAVANTSRTVDPFEALPPDALEGNVESLQLDGGIAVFPVEAMSGAGEACFSGDPVRCDAYVDAQATGYYTWEDLGFDPQEIVFGQVTDHMAYWSPDGKNFEPIEYPLPRGLIDRVVEVDGTAVVSISGLGPTRVLASEDARDWRTIGDGIEGGWLMALGESGGEMVMVTQNNAGVVSLYRAPQLDGPWEEVPVHDLLDDFTDADGHVWPTAAVVTDTGAAINVVVENPGRATSNPIKKLIDPLLARDRAAAAREEAAEWQSQGILLLSEDLANWTAVSTSHLGGIVDQMFEGPDGSLIAYGFVARDGSGSRLQGIAKP